MMARRIVDLSVALRNGVPSDPPPLLPKIEYQDHHAGFDAFAAMIPGLTRADLPDGEAGAAEWVTLTTHSGTHLDAPYHYHSTQDGGAPSKTIDEIDLDWCFQPGVKLDFRHFADGYVVQPADIDRELDRIGHVLQPLEIVLVNTAAGALYGTAAFVPSGCGMGRDATLHLLNQGIRLTGTDAWSWDVPLHFTAERFAASRDSAIIWDGHKAGREIGYCHLEKLTNLASLPPTGFTVACFPTKVHRGSAGWTRAVAIFD